MIFLLYIIGVIILSYCLLFMIINLNLFNMGYNFFEYVKFISIDSIFLILGLLLIIIYYYIRGVKKSDIHL